MKFFFQRSMALFLIFSLLSPNAISKADEQKAKISGSNGGAILSKLVLPFKAGDFHFIKILPGKFLMGSSNGEVNEKPEHSVEITKPFFISIYEVTQKQYVALGFENRSFFHDDLKKPVHNVTWYDAITFCNRLSEYYHLRPFFKVNQNLSMALDFTADGFRLPTEAEWEFACRAGTKDDHFWGKAEGVNEVLLGDIAPETLELLNSNESLRRKVHFRAGENFLGNDFCWDNVSLEKLAPSLSLRAEEDPAWGFGPQPVGVLLPNPWGLYDTLGNVSEWCLDTYLKTESLVYDDAKATDPFYWAPYQIIYYNSRMSFYSRFMEGDGLPFSGENHDGVFPEPDAILRGGSSFSERWDCRCSARYPVAIGGGGATPRTGFRIVKNIPK